MNEISNTFDTLVNEFNKERKENSSHLIKELQAEVKVINNENTPTQITKSKESNDKKFNNF